MRRRLTCGECVYCSTLSVERRYKLINPDFQSQIMTMPVNPNNQPQLAPSSSSQPRPTGPATIGGANPTTTSTHATPPSTGQSTPSKQQPAANPARSTVTQSTTSNLVQDKIEPVLDTVQDKAEDLVDVVTSGTQTPIKGGSSAGGSGKVSHGGRVDG